MSEALPKIITTHVYPPIPLRQFDWQAHYAGEEDERYDAGHGRTEAEAVVDLLENYPRGIDCIRSMAAAHPQQTRADLSPDGTGQPGCAAAATDKDED